MNVDHEMDELLEVMRRLRDPDNGCPWDLEQTFKTIAPYTIEEAYEVADAIERGAMDELRDELGDLLLQVVFHAQMASEAGLFDFAQVSRAIAAKMIRRHAHVFHDQTATDAASVKQSWEATKAQERGATASALDGVAKALPALMRAQKLSARAARVGFDWSNTDQVHAKLHEELDELAEREPEDRAGLHEELGDALFCMVNLARHHGVDAEDALRDANRKFERRFRHVEATVDVSDAPPDAATRRAMEKAWDAAKALEKKSVD
ncbi:MAG: nucleoside triphosphate pyrophosphohydrolase [Gammaproteobacteria bacterium]